MAKQGEETSGVHKVPPNEVELHTTDSNSESVSTASNTTLPLAAMSEGEKAIRKEERKLRREERQRKREEKEKERRRTEKLKEKKLKN